MKFYLIRHASAESLTACDDDRELTFKGQEEAKTVGTALAKLGAQPTFFLSSPLIRARQTAQLIARELSTDSRIVSLSELINGTRTETLLSALKSKGVGSETVLVGHMPSIADHLTNMIGLESTIGMEFGTASVASVTMFEFQNGAGQLDWFMRQQQLRLIAGS